MGREVVYCDVCVIRLLQAEFNEDGAITVNSRTYCIDCRKEAGIASPVTEPEPEPKIVKPSRIGTGRIPRARAPATRRSTVTTKAQPKGPNVPMIVGIVVGVLAVIIVVIVAASGGGERNGR